MTEKARYRPVFCPTCRAECSYYGIAFWEGDEPPNCKYHVKTQMVYPLKKQEGK